MKKVVVVNGFPQSGKDTFVRLASKYALVMNYSSVDFVKEVAKFAGWNGEKNLHTRKFLSDLKDLLTFLDNIPFKKIEERMRDFYNMEEQEILFVHIREPKEIEKLVKYHPDVVTLLIKRPDSEYEFSNHADAMVEEYPYDFIIANDSSLDSFESKAKEFVYNLKKEYHMIKFEKVSKEEFIKAYKSTFGDEVSVNDIEEMYDAIQLPQRATQGSAGYDIKTPISFLLEEPNADILIPTGIRAIMPNNTCLVILPRSGLGFKHYLRLANTVALIDAR